MATSSVSESRHTVAVLKRRSRSVTFRLSAEEYSELSKACLKFGIRSISDLSRTAVMHRVMALSGPQGSLTGDLSTLTKALRELDVLLREVRERIRLVLGDSGPDSGQRPQHEERSGNETEDSD